MKEQQPPKLISLAMVCLATFVVSTTNGFAVNAPLVTSQAEPPLPIPVKVKDPFERFNRAMFSFNDFLDKIIAKPIATLYNKIMPIPLNKGIHNFFNNMGEVPTIGNDILQLHFYQMMNDFWRLGINTTVGVGGLFDVASRLHLPYYSNDFGLTLARWGYVETTYIVWPFFGPSSIRETIEIPVDYFAFSLYPYIKPDSLGWEIYGLGIIDRRAQLLQLQPMMEEIAFDKYIFMRNAFLQNRAYRIAQNTQLGLFERNRPKVELEATPS